MPRQRANKDVKKPNEQYRHDDKDRGNLPPVVLGTPDTHRDGGIQQCYDPHLNPQLQWVGKVERTRFDVSTGSLHVYEHIVPRTIIEAVRKKAGPLQPFCFEKTVMPLSKEKKVNAKCAYNFTRL